MRSSGCRPYISIYLSIVHDSASVESTRGGSLTLAPIMTDHDIIIIYNKFRIVLIFIQIR